MRLEFLDAGFISRHAAGARPTDIGAGARLAVLDTGEILCTYMRTARTTTNDFVPVLCRSSDLGRTWSTPRVIWPHLQSTWSHFVSISRDSGGRLYLFGSRTPIDTPGESFWSDASQGLKANELIYATSDDHGLTWSEPTVIPMAIPGAAESPGAMCVTASRWIGVYSPCNTFDLEVKVDRSQVVAMLSDDQGRTWRQTSMLRFAEPESTAAEAWAIELSDGRLLGTSWHIGAQGHDLPNAFALSHDRGSTWTPTTSTGTMGQSTALAKLGEGRAIFLYNQRKHGEPGVWLAVARPTDTDFGIEHNEIVWRAEQPTQSATSSGELANWSDFSFGEPSAARLPDDTWLIALWCIQPSGTGIRYVRVKLHP